MKNILIFSILFLVSIVVVYVFITNSHTTPIKKNPEPVEYTTCKIYPRSNLNIPESDLTLSDKSEVVCTVGDKASAIYTISDKEGFEDAKNSIYRIWKSPEGYKLLVVDQNGAGSDEGFGKVLLIKDDSYELEECFYYNSDYFSNDQYPLYNELSAEELEYIGGNLVSKDDPYCSNFTFSRVLKN